MPAVLLGNCHKFCPRSGAINANTKRVWTKMPPSGQTIAAMSTRDVSLAHDEIAACKSFHVVADSINHTRKLVTDGHWHGNGFLRPLIPVVDVHIGTANRRLQYPDQHVIAASFRNRQLLQP